MEAEDSTGKIKNTKKGDNESGDKGKVGQNNMSENFSPFKPPNEEQVFITREAEKQKKKEAKEAAKFLKIWDKKTATSRMPLKRVKNEDIGPSQTEENIYNFSNAQRGFISAAMHIARSRVQFPREQRPQNISEFIDQKKEMFLVELSQNTIAVKITDLEDKKNERLAAFNETKLDLEQDTEKLIKFIESDNLKTQDKQREQESEMAIRKGIEGHIKTLDTKITTLKSEIDKIVDQLNTLEDHKNFLFKIFEGEENGRWVNEQKQKRQRKRNAIKTKWIAHAKQNMEQQEDEFLKEIQQINEATGNVSQKGGNKGKGQLDKKQINDADLEKIFEKRLKDDLIDVPEDYYEEEILFTEADQLLDIFTQLEEKNLTIIRKIQETEQTLELKKQEEIFKKKQFGGEIAQQEHQKQELENQILLHELNLAELIKQQNL